MNTKDKIIAETIRSIREQGYQTISLRNITKAIGITTGAFYKAFKDKNELFDHVRILEAQRQFERLKRNYLLGIDNPMEGILAIGQFILSEHQQDSNMMEFLYFSPTSVESFKRGDLLQMGDATTEFIALMGIEDPIEQNRLLMKLNTFITGYGLFIARGLVEYDEEFYLSVFDDLIGGYKK